MAGLAACSAITERTATMVFAVPGKFDLNTCQELEGMIGGTRARQTELEQLMARASQDAGGGFVSGVAYRSEYLQVRGDLKRMVQAKADKQCVADSKFSSGRAVF
jgi:hypothetical protein